jgi:DNA-binding transcriptional ArsR family regulator
MNVFDSLITSKIKIKILIRLFLNPAQKAYLRELANEFKVSPSQVSTEMALLKEASIVTTQKKGRNIFYAANTAHPLFPELSSMVKKAVGVDHIIDSIVSRLGSLDKALLMDDYARGRDSGIIDLLLVGHIDHSALSKLTAKAEKHIDRKIRTMCLTPDEYHQLRPKLNERPQLLLFAANTTREAQTPELERITPECE